MIKQIIAVIAVAVLMGVGIYYLTKDSSEEKSLITEQSSLTQTSELPTPTPLPSLQPFDQSTNLEDEVNILIPKDFTEEFQNLRNSI